MKTENVQIKEAALYVNLTVSNEIIILIIIAIDFSQNNNTNEVIKWYYQTTKEGEMLGILLENTF